MQTCNPPAAEILPFKEKERLFVLHDPELRKENPVEYKYHKLARSGCVNCSPPMSITCFFCRF